MLQVNKLESSEKQLLGTFIMSKTFIEDLRSDIFEVFGLLEFVPLRVYSLPEDLQLIGFSPYFDLIKLSETIPIYNIIIKKIEFKIKIKVIRLADNEYSPAIKITGNNYAFKVI